MTVIYCDSCGYQNRGGAKFCQGCGRTIITVKTEGFLSSGIMLDGRYEIKRMIKAGGMGAVYEALDHRFQTSCAVKEMLQMSNDMERETLIIDHFKKEAELLHTLRHSNLPVVKDYFVENGRYYLVMDYVEGKDLASILSGYGGKGIPQALVIEWSKHILDALDYLHSQKPPIVYLDLKPGNVMLRDADQKIILVDFGIARRVDPSTDNTMTIVGTPVYSPMELFEGKPEPRTDIYSLGATMHCLLTGLIPKSSCSFVPLRQFNQNISEELEQIVMKALSMRPSDRYDSAKHMRYELDRISAGHQSGEILQPIGQAMVQEILQPTIANMAKEEILEPTTPGMKLPAQEVLQPTVPGMKLPAQEVHPTVPGMKLPVQEVLQPTVPGMKLPAQEVLHPTVPGMKLPVQEVLQPTVPGMKLPGQEILQPQGIKENISPLKPEQSLPLQSKVPSGSNKKKILLPFLILCGILVITVLFILPLYRDSASVLCQKGLTLSKEEKYDEAIEWFEKALEKQDGYEDALKGKREALKLKADGMSEKGDYEEALNLYDKAIAIFPEYTEAIKGKKDTIKKLANEYEAEGDKLFEKGKYDDAIGYYEKVLDLEPDSRNALAAKARIFLKQNKISEAEKCLNNFIKLHPDDAVALDLKGLTMFYNKKYDEALKYIESSLKINSDNSNAWHHKGIMLAREGKYDEAIKCYNRAIAIEPDFCEALNDKANALYNLSNYSEAIKYYDRALKIKPDFAVALNNKGNALYIQGNYSEAVKCYDRVLKIDPDFKSAKTSRENSMKMIR